MGRDTGHRWLRAVLGRWRGAATRTAQAKIALLRIMERRRARILSTALSHLRARAAANLGVSLAAARAEGEGTAGRLQRAETLARIAEHRRVVLVERLAAAYNALRLTRPGPRSRVLLGSAGAAAADDVASGGRGGEKGSSDGRHKRRGSVSQQILDAAYREAVHGGVQVVGNGSESIAVSDEHVGGKTPQNGATDLDPNTVEARRAAALPSRGSAGQGKGEIGLGMDG